METPLHSRTEAKSLGLTRYFTGKPCQRGHTAARMTANKRCVECQRAAQNALNQRPEAKAKRQKYDRNRWLTERDALLAKNRRWQTENAEAFSSQKKAYYRANKAKVQAARLVWLEENRHVVRHHNAKRKKLIRQATPAWVDMEAIKAVYAEAERLEREAGTPYHVDHIIPLQGENVCGLHVPWNLQPLTAAANISKKNRLAA